MANKRSREVLIQKQKKLKFEKACKHLKYFSLCGAILCVVTILLYLVRWAYVYNTTISDAEVEISGFNCFAAGITGNYTSFDKSYGDMAVPFYYYAADYCKVLCVLTVIAFFTIIATVISEVVTFFTKKHTLNILSFLFALISAVLLIICNSVALSMKDSSILPIYCGGNTACSIRTYAIIPGIVALCIALVHFVAIIKYVVAKSKITSAE